MTVFLTMMVRMTRLMAVLAIVAASAFPASAAYGGSGATGMPIVSTTMHHFVENAHGGHDHGASRPSAPSHDHGGGNECGIHCVSSLPQIAVPQMSLPLTLSVTYACFSHSFSGCSVATLDRPPRS